MLHWPLLMQIECVEEFHIEDNQALCTPLNTNELELVVVVAVELLSRQEMNGETMQRLPQ